MLGVENLAGKGSGSGPGHAFRYPYCDPVSQGSTKPAQPHSLTAGGGGKARSGRRPSCQPRPFPWRSSPLCLAFLQASLLSPPPPLSVIVIKSNDSVIVIMRLFLLLHTHGAALFARGLGDSVLVRSLLLHACSQ